jgi:hypothetical protein
MKFFGDGGTSDNWAALEYLYLQSCLSEVGRANEAIVSSTDHHNVKVDLISRDGTQRLHFRTCPGLDGRDGPLLATGKF